MEEKYLRKGEDYSPAFPTYPPLNRYQGCRNNNDTGDDNKGYEQREPETFDDLGDFLEEIRSLDLFLRRTPCHVVRTHVCEDGLTNGDSETTEEKEANESKVQVIVSPGQKDENSEGLTRMEST